MESRESISIPHLHLFFTNFNNFMYFVPKACLAFSGSDFSSGLCHCTTAATSGSQGIFTGISLLQKLSLISTEISDVQFLLQCCIYHEPYFSKEKLEGTEQQSKRAECIRVHFPPTFLHFCSSNNMAHNMHIDLIAKPICTFIRIFIIKNSCLTYKLQRRYTHKVRSANLETF